MLIRDLDPVYFHPQKAEESDMGQPAEKQSQSRRKYPRRPFQRSVGVLSAGHYSLAQGYEIGEGGIAFVSDQNLEEGTTVVLNFQIPNGAFVSTICEVRSVEKNPEGTYTHGCLFRNIKFEHKREIRTFVSARG